MRIGVIGPTKVDTFCRLKGVPRDYYEKSLQFLAHHLANTGHTPYVVPDKDSTAHIFSKYYKEAGGKNLVGLCPKDDTEFGHSWLDMSVVTHVQDTQTWRNTPEELVNTCDVLLCLGLSLGTIIDIAYTKWYRVNKIFMIKEFVSPLPVELTHKIHCQWIGINDVVKLF